jgi:carboxypeptidase D
LATPLKGLLIGNGWFSPKIQYPAYVQYGEERGFFKKNNNAVKNAHKLLEQCNATLSTKQGDHVLVGVCEGLIGAVMEVAKTA